MGVSCEILDAITGNGKVPVRIAAAVLCLIFLVTQAITLDYFLVLHKGAWWWLWALGDAVTVACFIAAFVVSFKVLSKPENQSEVNANTATAREGELPLGYLVWLVYSILTATKLAIIFEDLAGYLVEADFFGPNVLKITVLLTGVIFLLLVTTHNNADHGSPRYAFINSLSHGVLFNLFDTVSILEILILEESHIFLTFSLHRIINAIGCLNIIIPFIPLLTLSRTRYGRDKVSSRVHAIHAFVYLVSINLPMFIIRLYLWHALHKDISVFFMKNALGIWFAVVDIYRSCRKTEKSKDSPDAAEEEHELRVATQPKHREEEEESVM